VIIFHGQQIVIYSEFLLTAFPEIHYRNTLYHKKSVIYAQRPVFCRGQGMQLFITRKDDKERAAMDIGLLRRK
jgi:hypothetical protein